MISSVTWVPRGVAQQHPDHCELGDAQFDELAKKFKLSAQDTEALMAEAEARMRPGDQDEPASNSDDSEEKPAQTENNDELAEYNLDTYDEEAAGARSGQDIALFSNVAGLMYYANEADDPYITVDMADEAAREERQELEVLPADNLLVACKTEDEVSLLEVYVYEDGADNVYVHHDVMLHSLPLCVERVACRLGAKRERPGAGNYVAVGTFEPEIEVWDLDVLDAALPEVVLGAGGSDKKRRSARPSAKRHTAAVLALASSPHAPNLLASASADTTVKLWDLCAAAPETALRSFAQHTDKVSAVAWHPAEMAVLATGAYDRTATVFDTRTPNALLRAGGLGGDVEALQWNPHRPEQLLVATDDGLIRAFDTRTLRSDGQAQAVFTLQAHDKPVATMQLSPLVPDCLLTGSEDRQVKLWDLSGAGPSCVLARDLGVGKVFTASWSPDVPLLACAAGSQGRLTVWNLWENADARAVFGSRVNSSGQVQADAGRSELATVVSDDHAGSSDDEAAPADDGALAQRLGRISLDAPSRSRGAKPTKGGKPVKPVKPVKPAKGVKKSKTPSH